MKNTLISAGLIICLASGCSSNPTIDSRTSNGLSSFLKGIAHLVLSPIQIAAGLLEGIASLPYYASTGLHQINKGLEDAQASITLDDTYESAYGKRIQDVSPDGETNERFRRMKHASGYLQKVLKSHGVDDSQNYFLTSIDTANNSGATLFAVIYRPVNAIKVKDKYDPRKLRNFTRNDRMFYEPFDTDYAGNRLDTIIDWAGIPVNSYQTQKMQAVLLTLAANAIIEGKRRSDYWETEKRWIDGEFSIIMQKQNSKTKQSLLNKA